jgi:hypothetical protein
MGRDELLRQKREKEEARKAFSDELNKKYKDPASIKYDLFDEAGVKVGYVEYFPDSDNLYIDTGFGMSVKGCALKSLRDILNKILDE